MCGIVGVYTRDSSAAEHALLALFALQHRGQDSAGIAYSDGSRLRLHKGMGLVKEVFPELQPPAPARLCIGHVRYPTQGRADLVNAQPHAYPPDTPTFALASNGDIVNYGEIREFLEKRGHALQSSNDGELLVHLAAEFARSAPLPEALRRLLAAARGAISAVLATPDALWVIRDPLGIRPLLLGRLPEGKGYVVASETVALDILDARYLQPVPPGAVLKISEAGLEWFHTSPAGPTAHCVFELIYFSRPDNVILDTHAQPEGRNGFPRDPRHYVYTFRRQLGARLAARDRVQADAVVPVPDSGVFIAMGYAEASGIPFQMGLIRNHYVGRTFIQPEQRYRDASVREKFHPVPGFFPGKSIVLVDDSIVRGTTMRQLVQMIRRAGAREIHLRIGSPPMRFPCFYGIDTPIREKLIANRAGMGEVPQEEIERVVADFLQVDSLKYLPLQDLRALTRPLGGFCDACFSGNYPAGTKDQEALRRRLETPL